MNLSEKALRRIFENGHGQIAADRKGRISHAYARWLEDIVRIYWPELNAMMDRESKRTRDMAAMRRQLNIFQQGGNQ